MPRLSKNKNRSGGTSSIPKRADEHTTVFAENAEMIASKATVQRLFVALNTSQKGA